MTASADLRRRRFQTVVWAGLILLLLGLTYAALTPRPDWYDAPFKLWPPHFRIVYGRFGTDKIEHVAAGFGLTLAVAFALDGFRPSARAARRAGVSIQLWCTAIEIIQGFLPYRNFELTDVLANLIGGLVGYLILHAHRRFGPGTMERDALDNRARLSKTARHVEAGPGRGVERSRS